MSGDYPIYCLGMMRPMGLSFVVFIVCNIVLLDIDINSDDVWPTACGGKQRLVCNYYGGRK